MARPPRKVPTNSLAIFSFVMGLACCIPLGPLIAIATGRAALRQIHSAEGREAGRGLAVSAIVLGVIASLLQLFAFLANQDVIHW